MSGSSKTALVVPIAIIAVGVGWLLNTLHVIPDIDWVWTIGLATIGIVTLALDGVNRVSVVVGPFFLISAVFSVLRQTQAVTENVEIPCLVIALGVLLLVAQTAKLPPPKWIIEPGKADS